MPRHGATAADEIPLVDEDLDIEPVSETRLGSRGVTSLAWWLPASLAAAAAAVVLVLVLYFTLSVSDRVDPSAVEVPDPEAELYQPRVASRPLPARDRDAVGPRGGRGGERNRGARDLARKPQIEKIAWEEPADTDPVAWHPPASGRAAGRLASASAGMDADSAARSSATSP